MNRMGVLVKGVVYYFPHEILGNCCFLLLNELRKEMKFRCVAKDNEKVTAITNNTTKGIYISSNCKCDG